MTATAQDPTTLRLLAGRVRATEKQPYLSTALYAIKPVKESRIPTLGVDANWRMYWNPDFIMTLSVDEVAACWLHEVGHLLRQHRTRFEALGEPRTRHPLWNRAGDACINQDLREAGVVLPPIKAVYPETIAGAKVGMVTEQIYRILLDSPLAEQIAQQDEALRLVPGTLIADATAGHRIVGLTRAPFLRADSFTVTMANLLDGSPVAVQHEQTHDRRTCSWTIQHDISAGAYLVTVASDEGKAEAMLQVIPPSINLRPDHIARGWTAPYKVTVVGSHTEFTPGHTVTLTDADHQPVAVENLTHVSDTYLTFEIAEQVPDGVYQVTVTGPHGAPVSTLLPIGVPYLDLTPDTLPAGHGTPYPLAAVAEDFTFDASTTFRVESPFGDPADALDLNVTRIKTATTADLSLSEQLEPGQYLVIARTGDEQAVATLTIATGTGEGSGEGEGEDSGEEAGEGEGSGEGEGEGSGEGEAAGDGTDPLDDCGSGAGGPQREWERGSDTSDGSVDEGRGNLIREQTARAIADHQKARGSVPGGWSRWANTILKPQVDWRKELRSVVRRTCATVAGTRDYTYTRPSRRASSVPNVVLPAMRAPRPPKVAVVVDTSGSVSDRMLGQALGDMQALLRQIMSGGGEDLKVIACDAAAADMKAVRDMRSLTTLDGGGGTDMRVGIEAAAAINPKVDLIVTFTDGETPWPEHPPTSNRRCKYVVVLLAGETSGHWQVPDWMHTVTVDDAYLRDLA